LRIIFLAYVLLLTLVLLVSDPFSWLDERTEEACHTAALGAHFGCFAVLTLLALTAGWPIGRVWVLALLAAYGAGTEVVQGFLPPRTAELADLAQDLAGIGVGVLVYQAWEWHARRRRAARPYLEAARLDAARLDAAPLETAPQVES
jgi:VanZ family protein